MGRETRRVWARRFWGLGVALGLSYWLGAMARSDVAFVQLAALPANFVMAWKSAGTGAIVAAAWMSARSSDGRRLALSLTTIWIADALLATGAVVAAGVLFVLAHILSSWAYARSFHATRSRTWQRTGGLLAPILVVATAIAATLETGHFAPLLLFPVFSGISAALAWQSRFPPMSTGIGAVIFCLSDALFVWGIVVDGSPASLGWLIWVSFFGGLALISVGLMRCEEAR